MKKLTIYFIENSFLVNMISALMIIVGLISVASMKRDLIPGWSSNSISIAASLSGAGPSQMEKFVTYPIEQVIKNHAGIDRIFSESGQGWVSITVSVKDDYKEISELEQKIKDAVANLRPSLPKSLDEIIVKQNKKTESWFSTYALIGMNEENNQHQLWFEGFKERFKNLKGVTRISDSIRTKNIYIQLRPKELARYQIAASSIYSKVIEAFTLFPIGSIKKGSETFLVEISNGEISPKTIGNIIISANLSGHQLRLKDLATIDKRLSKRTIKSFTNGEPSHGVYVFKDLTVDTIDLKNDVESFILHENKKMPKGIRVQLTGDGPSFIERQINALKSNSMFGAFLVVLTLMIFLGFKTSLMTSFGLPLSYCFTFFVLDTVGIRIDLISVIGMLLVLGILVDDAIIIGEQYSQNLEKGQEPKDAALNAVLETWIPITGTVLTTIVAFLPILFANDSLSKILFAIPVVIIASLGVSLFECFFILPNHLMHFVKRPKQQSKTGFMSKLKARYEWSLAWVLKLRYLVIPAFVGFMVFSIYFAKNNIPMDFNLNISSEKVRFLAVLKESKSIDHTESLLKDSVWTMLDKIDPKRYDYISARLGKVWLNGKRQLGPQYASFSVRFSQLDPNIEENKKYVEDYLNSEIKELKKLSIFEKLEVKRKYDGHDEMKDQMIEVNVSSMVPFNIENVTNSYKSLLKNIKGVKSVDLDSSKKVESWTFIPEESKIFSHGLTLSSLARQLRNYVTKSKIYEYKAGAEILKIYTYVEDGEHQTKESLGETPIILKNGRTVKTKDLGKWITVTKQERIIHENLKRSITIQVPFDEKLIKKPELLVIMNEINEKVSKLYPVLELKAQDADEQSRKNKKSVSKKVVYALIAIFFVLAIILRSLVQPLIICTAIPFGVIGVIWSFYFQGLKLDTMAFIGILGMAGVVVNDSLILVNTVNKMKTTWSSFKRSFIITGASSRLRPILLTSITTLGGVFPMAYGLGGDSGFTKPLAMSMGWGLLFATLLTLFVIPCMLLIQVDTIKLFMKIFKMESGQQAKNQKSSVPTNAINSEPGDKIKTSSDHYHQ